MRTFFTSEERIALFDVTIEHLLNFAVVQMHESSLNKSSIYYLKWMRTITRRRRQID